MSENDLAAQMLPAIETELKHQIERLNSPNTHHFYEMLTYHMGWTGEGAGLEAQGKRIRPLLLLLTFAATNGDWRTALPAAASVELVHNFSLVHDDIQDKSDKRRGRETVWNKWGVSQGINAGDALFVLSNHSLLDLTPNFSSETTSKAIKVLHEACLDLTRGQYLDISFEGEADIPLEDYWSMIGCKTAALLAACCSIGSLLGEADAATQEAYRSFGYYLGIAFQVQDDFLGIWGDSVLTGKSAESDLITRKKTLPILFGISKKGEFARQWNKGPLRLDDIPRMANQLASEGARLHTQEVVDQMTTLALEFLKVAGPQDEAREGLTSLVDKLLHREA